MEVLEERRNSKFSGGKQRIYGILLALSVVLLALSNVYNGNAPFSQCDNHGSMMDIAISEPVKRGPISKGALSLIDIPEKMYPAMVDLTPDEMLTIPVHSYSGAGNSTKKVLISGGKNCVHPKMMPVDDNKYIGRCCIGATSSGSHQNYFPSWKFCPQNVTAYNRVRRLAIEELDMYPILNTTSNPGKSNKLIMKCDICRIIYVLASLKHHKIAIAGDSVQRQLFTALECELNRRGFEISYWRRLKWPSVAPPPDRIAWKYGIHEETCFNVTVPIWMKDIGQDIVNLADTVEICHYDHYRPVWNMEQHQAISDVSDVMLIDYGVHFQLALKHEMEEYALGIERFLHAFKNISDCRLIYRETMAQHFVNHDTGEFNHKKTPGCAPHATPGIIPHRRRILFESAKMQNYSVVKSNGQPFVNDTITTHELYEVTLLPTYDFSAKLFNMHPSDKDCTHFCYTPHFWYPTWRHLRLTLDRIVDG